MEFVNSKPLEGIEIPDKQEFQRFLAVESEKIPGGVILAYLEEIIHHRSYNNSKEINKKLNSLDHTLILDLHSYALRLLTKIYENNDEKSWRELIKNPNFIEYCTVLGNTNYYKKMNASTNVNKLQIMAEILDISIKYKNSDNIQQITTFNEGKELNLYGLEYKNKIFFLFPNRHDVGIWRTVKKNYEEEKTMTCSVCDNSYLLKFFNHKICKCEICDLCISKHDGNKCVKCKKSIKKELLKKYQNDIHNNLCNGCGIRVPINIDKSCACRICMECVHESPLFCKSCGVKNYLSDQNLEQELDKKNIILAFLKEKLERVTDFEEKLISDLQDIYKIIEKSKNHFLKEIESIKKVISDNIKNLADLTLIRCLSLSKVDLEYSISQAVILNIQTSFDLKTFENFFDSNFHANFSIDVPVCYKCHQHLFTKPPKLTGCDCKLCKECIVKNVVSMPKCPFCGEITNNIQELEEYCGEKLQKLCKGCYQDKNAGTFFNCSKGCIGCFDCIKKYSSPSPKCPVCLNEFSANEVKVIQELGLVN